MVFGDHYLNLPWGWAGVDVFFVLSGFLITGILFDTLDGPHRARSFYLRRTLRIFPLYYGLVLLLLLSYPIFRWQWSWSWLLWPAYLGNFIRGTHNYADPSPLKMLADASPLSRAFPHVMLHFGHFWSLCVEEQFYLVWPWIVFWLRDRRKLLSVCLACVVACPLLRLVAAHTLPQFMLAQQVLYRWTPFRIDALLLGGFVALALRGHSPQRLLLAARIGFAALIAALLLWLTPLLIPGHSRAGYALPAWSFTAGLTLIDLFAACILVMALVSGSLAFRALSLRPLRWLGRISYGAYVFHDIPHSMLRQLAAHFTRHVGSAAAILALPLTLLLAWASFRWFESPFIRLKDRWTFAAPLTEAEPRRAALEPEPQNAVA
jgi:peptidoglycan/LPS O-acetylase OafA/YrhL